MSEHVYHTIPPVYDSRSRVLILGSMPSPKSRAAGFYYAHPQNRFWKTLAGVFGVPPFGSVSEKKEFCLRRGIALWDVIAECDIVGASDASVKNAVPNDFSRIMSECDIKAVFTTGRLAHDLLYKLCGLQSVCLPSPSAANRAVSDERLLREYTAIADVLNSTETGGCGNVG